MAKQILRFDPQHTMAGISQAYKHNVRQEIPSSEHIDAERTKNNVELISLPEGCKTIKQAFDKRISEMDYYKNHKIRKNAVLCDEIVMAFGEGGLPEDFSVSRWARNCEKYLVDTFGRENVLSAVVHMDESVPHIHAIVIPEYEGRLSAYKIHGTRDKLRQQHVNFYEGYMCEVGLEPEDEYQTGLQHGSFGKYYAALDKTFAQQLPRMEPGESPEAYYKRVNEIYVDQNLQIFNIKHKLEDLEQKHKTLKYSSKKKEARLRKEYEKQIQELNRNLERVNEKILDRLGGNIEQAVEAIEFKDHYEAMLEHYEEVAPERAKVIKDDLAEMERVFMEDIERGDMDLDMDFDLAR